MNDMQKNNAAAAVPSAGTEGTGQAAGKVSTSGIFLSCGYVTMQHGAMRIAYRAFNQEHEAIIPALAVRALQQPGALPVDVSRVEGDQVIPQVGRAWRSRSGRALMIRTIDSDGEIMVPWVKFRQVADGTLDKARVSRVQRPGPAAPAPAQQHQDQGGDSIRAGLAGGF